MSMKDFDWKKFFLEKGEKVGIGVAGGLMALLIVTGLFLPSHGFFSGSPAKNAKELDDLSKRLQLGLTTGNPEAKDKPDPDSHKRRIELDVNKVQPTDYEVAGLFEGRRPEVLKKRMPNLLNIDEMHVGYGAILADTYVFNNDFNRLYALKPTGKGAEQGNRNASSAASAFGRGGGFPGGGRGGGFPGAPGGGRPGSQGGFRGLPGQVQGLEETKKHYDVVQVDLAELNKMGDLIPARQLRPLRIGELVGSFPLLRQMKEFQVQMGLSSPEEVLQQTVLKDGKRLEAYRFVGVNVERRTLDPAGRPLPGPEGQWQPLDLRAAYRPWLILCGKRFEEDDHDYSLLEWPGLVMPKLLQFRDNKPAAPTRPPGPGMPGMPGGMPPGSGKQAPTSKEDLDNHYPAIEAKVHNLTETLNSLRANKGKVEITTPPQFDPSGWDPFNTAGVSEGPGKSAPALVRTGLWVRVFAALDSGTGSIPVVPEHCMVRLFDLNIEPGRTYQYRVQVRMANPLFGRNDVANPDWAKDEELQPTTWFEVPETLTVPPEVEYYAVDQKELDRNYKGLNADKSVGNNETTLQIHRWLDAVQIRGMGADPLLIGEWAVADRVIVARGEYVDRTVHIELPVWSYTQNAFVIATDQTRRSRSQHGFDVPFGHGFANKQETILIDFEGGRQDYKGTLKVDEDSTKEVSVRDSSATDVLLMDPEGRLLGHNSAVDAANPERQHRREQVQARVDRVKGITDKAAPKPSGGDKPFGPGS